MGYGPDGNQIGPPRAPANAGYGSFGVALQAGGAVAGAAGAYYSAQAAQYQAKSQAMALEHQQQMSFLTARRAEVDAQQALRAGQHERGQVGLRYAQAKADTAAKQSASGIQGGVGSSAEVLASIELAKQVDQITITKNSVRAASAHRTQRVNALSRGMLAGASAANVRASGDSISPGASAGISLLGRSGSVANNWYRYNRTT